MDTSGEFTAPEALGDVGLDTNAFRDLFLDAGLIYMSDVSLINQFPSPFPCTLVPMLWNLFPGGGGGGFFGPIGVV